MKKIFLSAISLFALISSYSQTTQSDSTTTYKSKKLKIEEVNLISSIYHQEGNNAAVTGGIGSEKLTDYANIIDVKLIRYDSKFRKHSIDGEFGIDYYTSASSDMIDLKANSSASHADLRIYPSLNYSVENEQKGTTIGGGLSFSHEFDYKSVGGNINFSKKTKDKSGEFTAKLQTYQDQVVLVTPVELRTNTGSGRNDYNTAPRKTYTASLSYTQIVNERLQLMFLGDFIQQKGYLSLPFHRVYFNGATIARQENLPDTRTKIPLAIRASYFLGDNIIIKSYYRFYTDNWGITAHTADLEVPIKINPFFSVSPFYRYYTQTACKYFAPYAVHTTADTYYTSNYDVSKFKSNFIGAGIKYTPLKGVLGIPHFNTLEIRYGHYNRTTNLNSNIISLNLKFK